MKRFPLALLLLLGACGAPGVVVTPDPNDFAFLEVKLRG